MNNEKYQKILESYSKNKRDKLGHKYFGDKVSILLYKLNKRYLKEPIIDVGAGTGALIKILKSRGYKNVSGFDLYPKANFIKKGIITNIKSKDNTYNTVFCSEVIEHLTDKQIGKGLEEIYRILKKNGIFIITIPYNENLGKNTFKCPNCKKKFHKVGHLQSFSKERIKKILENKKFKIISMHVYAFGVIVKIPFGKYFNWFFVKRDYELISKTLMIICKKI
jgi:ubiquinone/menaquinone biosynthesis C-methylase UbiE